MRMRSLHMYSPVHKNSFRLLVRNRPGDVVRDRHGGGQGAAHDEQDAYQDFDGVRVWAGVLDV